MGIASDCAIPAQRQRLGVRHRHVHFIGRRIRHKRCQRIHIAANISFSSPCRLSLKFINPEIVKNSETQNVFAEGCLSFPDHYSDVVRPETVTVRYLDENGTEKTIEASGILATCLQHEIDHTNGIVFVDHISKMKRDIIIRKLKKAKRFGLVEELPTQANV